jgi:acyl carrier protein
MHNVARVRERLLALFTNNLSVDVPSVDVDLFDTGILDASMFLELLLHLEREFGIKAEMDDMEIDKFRSISCIAQFVIERGDVLEFEDAPDAVRPSTTH